MPIYCSSSHLLPLEVIYCFWEYLWCLQGFCEVLRTSKSIGDPISARRIDRVICEASSSENENAQSALSILSGSGASSPAPILSSRMGMIAQPPLFPVLWSDVRQHERGQLVWYDADKKSQVQSLILLIVVADMI